MIKKLGRGWQQRSGEGIKAKEGIKEENEAKQH